MEWPIGPSVNLNGLIKQHASLSKTNTRVRRTPDSKYLLKRMGYKQKRAQVTLVHLDSRQVQE